MKTRGSRIGILGGTFDPIHLGHLRTAEEMAYEMELQKILLIPAAIPPHKTQEPVTPFIHRLEMTRLAAASSPVMEVSDIEGKRDGPSYSIETLKELEQVYGPGSEFFFILGTDAFEEIHTWKDYPGLFSLTNFIVIQRPGFEYQGLDSVLTNLRLKYEKGKSEKAYLLNTGKRVFLMKATNMEISSTRIRALVKSGRSIRFLVPEAVIHYIEDMRIYRG